MSMSELNTEARTMHDLGSAAWFGGSLAGAVGIDGAAADVPDEKLRLVVANAGGPVGPRSTWPRSSALGRRRRRALCQQGPGRHSARGGGVHRAKLALTGAALRLPPIADARQEAAGRRHGPGPWCYRAICRHSRRRGQGQAAAQGVPAGHPGAHRGLAVLNVVEGEQQRLSQVMSGILAKPAQLLGIASGADLMRHMHR